MRLCSKKRSQPQSSKHGLWGEGANITRHEKESERKWWAARRTSTMAGLKCHAQGGLSSERRWSYVKETPTKPSSKYDLLSTHVFITKVKSDWLILSTTLNGWNRLQNDKFIQWKRRKISWSAIIYHWVTVQIKKSSTPKNYAHKRIMTSSLSCNAPSCTSLPLIKNSN